MIIILSINRITKQVSKSYILNIIMSFLIRSNLDSQHPSAVINIIKTDLEPDDFAALFYLAKNGVLGDPTTRVVLSESTNTYRKLAVFANFIAALKSASILAEEQRIHTFLGPNSSKKYPWKGKTKYGMPENRVIIYTHLQVEETSILTHLKDIPPFLHQRFWVLAPLRDFVRSKYFPENYSVVMYGSFNVREVAYSAENRSYLIEFMQRAKFTYYYESFLVTGDKNVFTEENASELFSLFRSEIPLMFDIIKSWNVFIVIECFEECCRYLSNHKKGALTDIQQQSLQQNYKIIKSNLDEDENPVPPLEQLVSLSQEEFMEMVERSNCIDKRILSCDIATVVTFFNSPLADQPRESVPVIRGTLKFTPVGYVEFIETEEGHIMVPKQVNQDKKMQLHTISELL